MPEHIKLYGSKADRFETIKRELTASLGYEPSNPEVVGILMASFDRADLPIADAHGSSQLRS